MEFYINEQFGRVYIGEMAVNDRVATQAEVDAYNQLQQEETVKNMTVSSLQGMMAMAQAQVAGITNFDLLSKVKELIAATDDQSIHIAWERAVEWKRSSALINALGEASRLTPDQLDRLFLLASTIEV